MFARSSLINKLCLPPLNNNIRSIINLPLYCPPKNYFLRRDEDIDEINHEISKFKEERSIYEPINNAFKAFDVWNKFKFYKFKLCDKNKMLIKDDKLFYAILEYQNLVSKLISETSFANYMKVLNQGGIYLNNLNGIGDEIFPMSDQQECMFRFDKIKSPYINERSLTIRKEEYDPYEEFLETFKSFLTYVDMDTLYNINLALKVRILLRNNTTHSVETNFNAAVGYSLTMFEEPQFKYRRINMIKITDDYIYQRTSLVGSSNQSNDPSITR